MNRQLLPSLALALVACFTDAADVPSVATQPAQMMLPSTSHGLWIVVGPGSQILPAGVYRFLFIPAEASELVQVTTINAGGDVLPPPPPPAPDDLRAQVKSALAKVTTDADRKTTAQGLAGAYVELAKTVDAGQITDVKQLGMAVNALTGIITAGKPMWVDFNKVLSDCMAKCTVIKHCAEQLRIVADELGKVT